jgi:hypothetical protein
MGEVILLIVKPCVAAQTENGEQLLQSFLWSLCEVCSVFPTSSHLSKTEHGTIALNRMYKDNMYVIHFFIPCKNSQTAKGKRCVSKILALLQVGFVSCFVRLQMCQNVRWAVEVLYVLLLLERSLVGLLLTRYYTQ